MRKDYRQNFRIGSNVKKIEQAFGAKKKKKKKSFLLSAKLPTLIFGFIKLNCLPDIIFCLRF